MFITTRRSYDSKRKKQAAQDLIMDQISIIGYGDRYEKFVKEIGEEADQILFKQMNRDAKLFGYEKAWFA